MKKKSLLLLVVLIFCLLITACGNESVTLEENNDTNSVDSGSEFKSPEIEWWELYNPNGFDTVTVLISNPNDIAIDVTYDLVYYKDGKEVSRSEGFSNFSILPNHKDIIWANNDIPKSSDVDDIKLENVTVVEAYEKPIDGVIELDGIGTECELYFLPILDEVPSYLSAWFVFYNDLNGNDMFDKGEILLVDNGSVNTEDRWICIDPVENYTDVDVYFTAY